ncbi:MAG: GH3 auxin-responsive promoter family protein, partial [Bacteroidia bacterium]|nr:GH3 auxin-responsive promoter family protein [Bacteroidia bacterium]
MTHSATAAYMRFRRPNSDDDQAVLRRLLERGKRTAFGRDHGLADVRDYSTFCKRVPIRSYEELFPYIERVMRGEKDVLSPGETLWFAKSSGTTNDRSKFIPIPYDNLYGNHYAAGKDMIAAYLRSRPDSRVFCGKTLSIGGSLEISRLNNRARVGDVSAVLLQNLPRFYEWRRAPKRSIALMGRWEEKIAAMARDVYKQDITAIVGVPTWTAVLIEKIFELEKQQKGSTSRDLSRIWPNLEVFFHGGVSFAPYENLFREWIRSPRMVYREVYNASEGFFAFQDREERGMRLLLDRDVFFEFLPDDGGPPLRASETQIGKPYAVVVTTSGGLWRYAIGDVVKFVDKRRIAVVGRTKHYINAF